jgi:hypothetical protein
MAFDGSARLIWSLASNGPATAITASGNSGAYTATPNPGVPRTAVDLRRVDDVWLSVYAAAASGTTPSITVSLGAFDDQGNLFGGLLAVTALTAAGGNVAFGGRHGGGSGSYFVLPDWGRIAWVVTGTTPSFTGLEIALYGR